MGQRRGQQGGGRRRARGSVRGFPVRDWLGWLIHIMQTSGLNPPKNNQNDTLDSDPSLADGRFLLALIAAIEPRAVDWTLVTSGPCAWLGHLGGWIA